jgi:hypothetical protein
MAKKKTIDKFINDIGSFIGKELECQGWAVYTDTYHCPNSECVSGDTSETISLNRYCRNRYCRKCGSKLRLNRKSEINTNQMLCRVFLKTFGSFETKKIKKLLPEFDLE